MGYKEKILEVIANDDELERMSETVVDHITGVKLIDALYPSDVIWFTVEYGQVIVHINPKELRAILGRHTDLFITMIKRAMEKILEEG